MLLGQGGSQSHHNRSLDLAFGILWIDHLTYIVSGDYSPDFDLAGLQVQTARVHEGAVSEQVAALKTQSGAPVRDDDPAEQIKRLALWDNGSDKLVQSNHPDMGEMFYDRDGDGQPDLIGSGRVLWTALSSHTNEETAPLTLAGFRPSLTNVVINEFLANNGGGLRDEDLESPDWIELHNTGPAAVNLGGWHLTDNVGNPTKWTFPATNLPAGGYLVVFASGKNRANPGWPLHANFQLDNESGYLALVQPGGTVEHAYSPAYPNQRQNVSYGLETQTATTTLAVRRNPRITDVSDADLRAQYAFSRRVRDKARIPLAVDRELSRGGAGDADQHAE